MGDNSVSISFEFLNIFTTIGLNESILLRMSNSFLLMFYAPDSSEFGNIRSLRILYSNKKVFSV